MNKLVVILKNQQTLGQGTVWTEGNGDVCVRRRPLLFQEARFISRYEMSPSR